MDVIFMFILRGLKYKEKVRGTYCYLFITSKYNYGKEKNTNKLQRNIDFYWRGNSEREL